MKIEPYVKRVVHAWRGQRAIIAFLGSGCSSGLGPSEARSHRTKEAFVMQFVRMNNATRCALRSALVATLWFAGSLVVDLGAPCVRVGIAHEPPAAVPGETASRDAVEWLGGSRLVRAAAEPARQHLERSDLFTRALSPFDRMSRLGQGSDPGEEAVRRFAGSQAIAWSDADWKRLVAAATSLRRRLEGLPGLPWPKEVLMIQTTGKEEGGAAYCRGAAVILPVSVAGRPAESLERLLAHELFHVLSNQNPEWRRRVYSAIGFEPCPEIPLPDSLRDRKITNPDGPLVDCRLELSIAGAAVHVAPVLLANAPYDATKGGSFFPYLTFRLIEIEPAGDGAWRVALRDGQPRLLDPQTTPAYFERIGRNTKYIIHPDEILADNFTLLVFGAEKPTSPAVLGALRERLGPVAEDAPRKTLPPK